LLVLGLLGSPRRAGNTETLLDAALDGACRGGARIEKVVLNEIEIKACQGCNRCLSSGECVVKDGMTSLYELIDQADAIIIASPIYFSGLTAQTKLMIDRCQCLWARGEKLGRKVGGGKKRTGLFLSVGGDPQAMFRNAVSEVKAFYSSIEVDYCGELLLAGIESKGEITSRPESLERAIALGEDLARGGCSGLS
jgi:multimeric flavodoxin WrbA